MDGPRRQRYLDKLQLLELRCKQVQEWTAAASPDQIRDDLVLKFVPTRVAELLRLDSQVRQWLT